MTNNILIEYDEKKNKFYVSDEDTKELIETFYGEYTLKEYLLFDRMLSFDEANYFIMEVYTRCH